MTQQEYLQLLGTDENNAAAVNIWNTLEQNGFVIVRDYSTKFKVPVLHDIIPPMGGKTPGFNFLHTHPNMERQLNIPEGHVIVDEKDLREVLEKLNDSKIPKGFVEVKTDHGKHY